MLSFTCRPQKSRTHTTKSQSSNHLWVFSLQRNLQLPRVQCLSLKSRITARIWSKSWLLSCLCARDLWLKRKTVQGLCLVLDLALLKKSKERFFAELPEHPNDVLLLSSPSLCFPFCKWQWVRKRAKQREGEGERCAGTLVDQFRLIWVAPFPLISLSSLHLLFVLLLVYTQTSLSAPEDLLLPSSSASPLSLMSPWKSWTVYPCL